MTYEEIIRALRERKCESTETALDRAVRDEALALIDSTSRYRGVRRAEAKRAQAVSDAAEFYAADITNQLADPVQPTPHRMLSLRRFATTWAVAEVLRTNDDITDSGTKVV